MVPHHALTPLMGLNVAQQLRAELKEFERDFRLEHGREPAKSDIKSRPLIASKYRAYAAAKAPRTDPALGPGPAPTAARRASTPVAHSAPQIVANPFRSPAKSRPSAFVPDAPRWLDGPTGTTPTKRGSWQRRADPAMASRPLPTLGIRGREGRAADSSGGPRQGSGRSTDVTRMPVRAFRPLFDDLLPSDSARPAQAQSQAHGAAGDAGRPSEDSALVRPAKKRPRHGPPGDSVLDTIAAGQNGTANRAYTYRRWLPDHGTDRDTIDVDLVEFEALGTTSAERRQDALPASGPERADVDASCPADLVALLDLRGSSSMTRQRDAEARERTELWGAVLQEPADPPAAGLADLEDAGAASDGSSEDEVPDGGDWDKPERA